MESGDAAPLLAELSRGGRALSPFPLAELSPGRLSLLEDSGLFAV
jgi:hypothetical protein